MAFDRHMSEEELLTKVEQLRHRNDELESLLVRARSIAHVGQNAHVKHPQWGADSSLVYLDAADVILVALSVDGVVTMANRKACEVLGCSAEQVVGQNWFDRFVPEGKRGESRSRFEDLVSGVVDLCVANESSIVTSEGLERVVSWRSNVLRDESGAITGVVITGDDISQLRSDMEAFRQDADSLRRLIESANMVVFRRSVPEGEYQYVSPSSAEVCGLAPSELYASASRLDEIVSTDCRASYQEQWERVVSASGPEAFEYQIVRESGESRLLHQRMVPVVDQQGRVNVVVGIITDVTESNRAEQLVDGADERIPFAVEATGVGAWDWLIAEDRVCLSPEAERMVGIIPGTFGGTFDSYIKLTYPEDRDRASGIIRRFLDSGRDDAVVNYSHRIVRADGEIAWVEIRGRLSRDDSGQPLRLTGVCTDVTWRKRAEEEAAKLEAHLRQAQKTAALGEIASGVAHDCSNLLSAITGHAKLAKASLPNGHEAMESLVHLEEAARQASSVTRSVLALSRHTPSSMKPVEFQGLATRTVRMLSRILPRSIETRMYCATSNFVWVRADETQLQQLVMNLMLNARDAMPEGGSLDVEIDLQSSRFAARGACTERANEVVRLIVRDTGKGMKQEVADQVFEPFFSTKGDGEGKGLGLSISRRIVEEHGGEMSVTSEVGRGTEFTVLLPTMQEDEVTRESHGVDPASRRKCETILLAQSGWNVRSMLATALESANYRVIEADDGPSLEAEYRANKEDVGLLLIDAGLHGKCGLECLRDIRSAGDCTPAIVTVDEAECPSADDVDEHTKLLHRPFEVIQLARLIGQQLGHSLPEVK